MKRLVLPIALLPLCLTLAACTGTTGDELVSFSAYAAGAMGAGDPFESGGWTVQFTFAQMYVGAVYVNEGPPDNGATFDTPTCIDPGIYCAQVPGGQEVDLLNPSPQPFKAQGNGTADLGLSWEIYLVDGDVNNPDIAGFGVPNTVDLQGTATRGSDGMMVSWAATVTINTTNRLGPAPYAYEPGLYPICKQRILELGDISLSLSQGDSMLLTIDPRGWFALPIDSASPGADFSTLPPVTSPQCTLDQSSIYGDAQVCIPDSSQLQGTQLGQPQGLQLFSNIQTAGSGAYTLTYPNSP